jgi:vanillate/3-O-methylgallate O-demethylase
MADNLKQLIDQAGGPRSYLGNTGAGGYVFPVVPPEQSSWQAEQLAWMTDCVLMDQTHHMDDLYIEGPDAVRLLSDTGINSFSSFRPGMAKQHIMCNHEGYLIGDNILAWLHDGRVMSAGLGPGNDWLEFQARKLGYDVQLTKNPRTPPFWDGRPIERAYWRYQIQGPKAWALIEKLNGAPVDDIRFFHMTTIMIAGRKVEALRHGMAGAAGLEIWGPIEEQAEVLATILEAGREFGLRQVGNRAYATSAVESGWWGALFPAVYSGAEMDEFLATLPPYAIEAFFQLGGSFSSDRIEDYYKTPFDIGYDQFIKFDHEFIGRSALEEMVPRKADLRRKVTLEWHPEDAERIFGSLWRDGPNFKYLDLPVSLYAFGQNDRVERGGGLVGLSQIVATTLNAKRLISLASVDQRLEIGSEVEIVWGEEPGVYGNVRVEPHVQTRVRATVCTAPYSKVAREELRQR